VSENILEQRRLPWYTGAVENMRRAVMGKYAGAVIGAAVVVLGVMGLISWWKPFVIIFRGTVPALLIFGGAIAVIAGVSEIKDEMAAKKEETK
jgi:hypothetical protein